MYWIGTAGLLLMLACGMLLSRQDFARRYPQRVRLVAGVGVVAFLLGLLAVLGAKIAAGEGPALLFAVMGMLLAMLVFGGLLLAWQHLQSRWRRPRLPAGVDRKIVLAAAPYDYAAWQGEGFRIWHVDAPDDFLAGGLESQEEVEDWIIAEVLRTGGLAKH